MTDRPTTPASKSLLGDDLFRLMVESARDYAIFTTDGEGRVTTWNVGAERVLGFREAEILGRDVRIVFTPEDNERDQADVEMKEALEEGRAVDCRWHVHKDGHRFWADGLLMPLKDDAGRVVGFLKIIRDRTAEKRSEEALQEGRALYRAIAANLPGGAVFLVDHELRYRLADGEALREAGFSSADLEGKAIREVFPPELAERFESEYRALLAGEAFQTEHEAHGRSYSSHGVPLKDARGSISAALVVSYDITVRKRAEEAARVREERLRLATETAKLGTWDLELQTQTARRSARHDQIFGYESPLPEWSYAAFLEHVVPEDRPEVDGTFRRALEEHAEWHFRCRIRRADGVIRWIEAHGTPYREATGEVTRLLGVVADVTEQKELERELRHRARELGEADQRKNEFLAMLAHELRNPLSAIHTAVRVAQAPKMAEHLPQSLEIIERQAKNLARLIDDLLDVSRITQGKVELKRETIDVIGVINRAAQAAMPLIEQKHHRLTFQHDFGPLWVDADPTRLEQIVGNLLTNAAKYTEPSGHISVSASREGGEVVIRVRDDGVGIPPEMLPRVFDLFTQVDRSLARSEGGLGIGLSLVKRLVEMHKGSIEATSELGHGSEFTVRLPLDEAAAEETEPERAADVSGAGRRILIVDDNADTARLTGRLLQSLGFEVKLSHDGRESVEVAREFRPEVVLLDIGLPGMSGFEVARQLRQESSCPDSLIIGVSGYGDQQAREEAREAGFDHHLVKPVDIDAITELVSRPRRP